MSNRETTRSLGMYFILVGLFSGYMAYLWFSRRSDYPLGAWLYAVEAAAFLGTGILFKKIITHRPGLIVGLLAATVGFQMIILGWAVVQGRIAPAELLRLLIPAAFTVYLIINVRRLAHEAREQQGPIAPARD